MKIYGTSTKELPRELEEYLLNNEYIDLTLEIDTTDIAKFNFDCLHLQHIANRNWRVKWQQIGPISADVLAKGTGRRNYSYMERGQYDEWRKEAATAAYDREAPRSQSDGITKRLPPADRDAFVSAYLTDAYAKCGLHKAGSLRVMKRGKSIEVFTENGRLVCYLDVTRDQLADVCRAVTDRLSHLTDWSQHEYLESMNPLAQYYLYDAVQQFKVDAVYGFNIAR